MSHFMEVFKQRSINNYNYRIIKFLEINAYVGYVELENLIPFFIFIDFSTISGRVNFPLFLLALQKYMIATTSDRCHRMRWLEQPTLPSNGAGNCVRCRVHEAYAVLICEFGSGPVIGTIPRASGPVRFPTIRLSVLCNGRLCRGQKRSVQFAVLCGGHQQ